jgi:O-antigen ligase
MTGDTTTYLVAGIGGLIALIVVIALVFVPVMRMYATWWQRGAAAVLALVVVGAFAMGGVYAGLSFVDRFLS